MASQYSLNLKAVLDTTQVKQELQKLRQMQNQILGNNRSNSVNGGTSNSSNLGNINGLNSTLSRLTNSINQLNNAITKLNTFNHNTTVLKQTNPINLAPPSYQHPVSTITRHIEELYDEKQGVRIRRASEESKRPWDVYRNRTKNSPKTTQVTPYNPDQQYETPKIPKEFWKSSAGFFVTGVGQILNAGANLAAVQGKPQYAKNLQAGATTLGMAGTGAMIGSAIPVVGTAIGAGVGAVVGGVVAAFEYMTNSLAETNQELQVFAERVRNAAQIEDRNVQRNQQKEIQGLTDNGQLSTLKSKRDKVQQEYDSIVAEQKALGIDDDKFKEFAEYYKQLKIDFEAAKDESNTFEEWFNLEDSQKENDLRKKYRAAGPKFEKYVELQAKRDRLYSENQSLDSAVKTVEQRKKTTAETTTNISDMQTALSRSDLLKSLSKLSSEDLTKKLKEYETSVIDSRKTYESTLSKAKGITGLSVKEQEERANLLKDANRQKQTLDYNESVVTAIKSLIETEKTKVTGFNKIIDAEKLGIAQYNETNDLNRLIKTGNISGIREATLKHRANRNNAFDLYQSTLNEAALATDSKTKEELLEKANKYKSDWQYSSNTFDNLNQNLGQLLVAPLQDALSKLQAPNMENVNSLASQGVMINRADDASREQSILDYQREQTELQRQIKDLLEVEDYTNQAPIIQ